MAKTIEYVLPSERWVKKQLKRYPKRVLAFDPGYRNMGVAVIGCNPKKRKVKVLATAVMMNPIADLVSIHESHPAFMAEVAQWVNLFQPHGIIAERFQIRGSSSAGKSCEAVSIMLGSLKTKYEELAFKLVIAAQWKIAMQRRFGIDLKEEYKATCVLPHQLDACLIGCYGLEFGLDMELNYDVESIYLQAEERTLVPLINRKGLKR